MTFNIMNVLMYLYNDTKNYYSVTKSTGTSQEQYDTLTWNSQEDPPIAKPSLAYLEAQFTEYRKEKLCEEVDALFNSKLEAALVSYDSATFKADNSSQIIVHGAACNGDKSRTFYDSKESTHEFTKTQAIELSGILSDCTKAYEANKKALKDAINAAQDPDTIDLESGWPVNPFTGS